MIISGFTDEAGQSLETQIEAIQALGWTHLSARSIDGQNIHDLSETDFEKVANRLDDSGIQVIEFGSLIGSWSKPIETDFALTLAEIERAIPRMKRLKTKMIRIMSYAQKPWQEDQNEKERFRRLREIVRRFADEGLQALHENCMNWGGFSPQHTLRLINEVPGLRLIFDTGNPIFQRDRSKPEPFPWQDPLEFYETIKDFVAHIHIKDCLNPIDGNSEPEQYVFPGKGTARLPQIIHRLKANRYAGSFAIEPHITTVFHAKESECSSPKKHFQSFISYGQAFEQLLKTEIDHDTGTA